MDHFLRNCIFMVFDHNYKLMKILRASFDGYFVRNRQILLNGSGLFVFIFVVTYDIVQ